MGRLEALAMPREIDELLAIKRTGERQQLRARSRATWRARLAEAIDAVDDAWPTSVLPAEPPESAVEAIDAWLQEVRRANW